MDLKDLPPKENELGCIFLPSQWNENWQVWDDPQNTQSEIGDDIIRLKLVKREISPTYLRDFLNSEPCKRVIKARAVINQQDVLGKKTETLFIPALARIPIPLAENYFESDLIKITKKNYI